MDEAIELMEHEVEIVDRKDIPEDYLEWIDKESHHNHLIVKDNNGTLRWKETPSLHKQATENCGNMNEIWGMFYLLGWDKNSEQAREFYRKIGYSLHGYWEVFHWEANNPEHDKYVQKVLAPSASDKSNPDVNDKRYFFVVFNMYRLGELIRTGSKTITNSHAKYFSHDDFCDLILKEAEISEGTEAHYKVILTLIKEFDCKDDFDSFESSKKKLEQTEN